jgi:hypothetical protein
MALISACGSVLLLLVASRRDRPEDDKVDVRKAVEELMAKRDYPNIRRSGADPARWLYPRTSKGGAEWRLDLGMRMLDRLLGESRGCPNSVGDIGTYVGAEVWRLSSKPKDETAWLKSRSKDYRRACDLRLTTMPMY